MRLSPFAFSLFTSSVPLSLSPQPSIRRVEHTNEIFFDIDLHLGCREVSPIPRGTCDTVRTWSESIMSIENWSCRIQSGQRRRES
jgi:hypothetical protein